MPRDNSPPFDGEPQPVQRNSFQQYLESIHAQCAHSDSGEVASYIPELAQADPRRFGIALITVQSLTLRSFLQF